MANLFTSYLKEAYVPQVVSTIIRTNFWLGQQPFFEIVQPGACPAGPHINGILEYARTTNAAAYTQGNPLVTPGVLSDVRFYQNKDWYQNASKLYGNTKSMLANGSNADVNAEQKTIETCVQDMVEIFSSTALVDLAAQVDSATAFSDASLSRVTYDIASIEHGSIGDLAKADLTGIVAEMVDLGVSVDDMVFVVPSNQLTNIAAFAGTAYNEFSIDGSSMGPVDLGTRFRCQTFEQIPILVCPGMTTSEIYLLRKSQTKIFLHEPIVVEDKPVDEWASLWASHFGANLLVLDPKRCAKLTGVTV